MSLTSYLAAHPIPTAGHVPTQCWREERKQEEEERQRGGASADDYLAQTRGWQVPEAFMSAVPEEPDPDDDTGAPTTELTGPPDPATSSPAPPWETREGTSGLVPQEPEPAPGPTEEARPLDPPVESAVESAVESRGGDEGELRHLERVLIRDEEGREISVLIDCSRGRSRGFSQVLGSLYLVVSSVVSYVHPQLRACM